MITIWLYSTLNFFNCQIGILPITYLGIPVPASRLYVVDWARMEEKSAKKLDVWQGNSASIGGRTILINTSLTNTAIYFMSMFITPMTVIKRMDKNRTKFFWQGGSLKKKYHLVKWTVICKSRGGLGVKDLRKTNISLLCKWW